MINVMRDTTLNIASRMRAIEIEIIWKISATISSRSLTIVLADFVVIANGTLSFTDFDTKKYIYFQYKDSYSLPTPLRDYKTDLGDLYQFNFHNFVSYKNIGLSPSQNVLWVYILS